MNNVSKAVVDDVFAFAKRHNLDTAALLVFMADGPDQPDQTNTAVVLAGAEARAVADAVVERAEPDEFDMQTTEAFEIAKRFWISQPPGFVSSSREIYECAGLPWPRKSRRLTEWLIRSHTAKRAGSYQSCMAFERT